ncbi:hypothetical protein CKJ90_33335, partial [Klebsiella pneumoniae]
AHCRRDHTDTTTTAAGAVLVGSKLIRVAFIRDLLAHCRRDHTDTTTTAAGAVLVGSKLIRVAFIRDL